MAAINLKEHYPTTYTEDFLVEVYIKTQKTAQLI